MSKSHRLLRLYGFGVFGRAASTPAAPANFVAPEVTGTPTEGQVLSTSDGTWSGAPTITYTRVWQQSSNGVTSWFAISGATGKNYTLQAAQVGKYIRCVVTATNGVGSSVANSNVVGPVTSIPASYTPSLNYSDARNSQYALLLYLW